VKFVTLVANIEVKFVIPAATTATMSEAGRIAETRDASIVARSAGRDVITVTTFVNRGAIIATTFAGTGTIAASAVAGPSAEGTPGAEGQIRIQRGITTAMVA